MKKGFNAQGLNKGFTLVELMVALSLFVIVVLAAVSSLYSVNDASRKVTAMRAVLDNLNFAVESMSRTLRTGESFVCGGGTQASPNCDFMITNGSPSITVNSTLGGDQVVTYAWYQTPQGTGQVRKQVTVNGRTGDWMAITAPEIDVEDLRFYVSGARTDDGKQPAVMMFIRGVASAGSDNIAPFALQTLVSQRASE